MQAYDAVDVEPAVSDVISVEYDPDAGYRVFAAAKIASNTVFGPYEGKTVKLKLAAGDLSAYSWLVSMSMVPTCMAVHNSRQLVLPLIQ